MSTRLNWQNPSEAGAGSAVWLRRALRYRPSLLAETKDLLEVVIAHVPHLTTDPILEVPLSGPVIRSLTGTVVSADIDGFTPLSERFSRAASEAGAEELTDLVNRFLEILIRTTVQYGGDLLKFGGDAGLLLFQGQDHALRAVSAAMDVQDQMRTHMEIVATSLGSFPFRVAIGIGSGDLLALGLGDQDGQELLPIGLPLDAMGRAQCAAPPGEIVLHQAAWASCPEGSLSAEQIEPDLYRVSELRQHPGVSRRLGSLAVPQLPDDEQLLWMLMRLDALTPYLPPGLLDRLTVAPALDRLRLWSELRQVTVMMVSLSDLPEIRAFSEDHVDLESALRAANERFVQLREVIRRYDGVLNKIAISPHDTYLMVLFGAPYAHEDDPLRAVLAALELQEKVPVPLRFGINTGYVFAGDVGSAERREYTVMGDEVNLAARLMSACCPGEVWLGPKAAQHPAIRNRVLGASAPPISLPGKLDPIAPFVAQGLRRVALDLSGYDTPLLGRDEEIDQLMRLLSTAQQGDGRVVLLHGSAGVGKSRLLQDLIARSVALGIPAHLGAAASYEEHLPFAGWDEVLTSLLALGGLTGDARSEAFQAAMDRRGVGCWAALIAPLVGVTVRPSSEVMALPPSMVATQRQSVLLEMLGQTAGDRAQILAFDNVQWMSNASLELLDVVLSASGLARTLVILSYRDPSTVSRRWRSGGAIVDLALGPLPLPAIREVLHARFQDNPLPDEVVRWVAKRSGGLPIFATEAVRVLLESGVLRRADGAWELSGALDDVLLPDMVYSLVQSRIDQLSPPDRHLLRAAAVVGNEMTLPMLVAGYGEEAAPAVRRRLSSLVPFGLTARDEAGDVLSFRQPLVREVAFRGLPGRVRRQIHQRLAEYVDLHQEKAAPDWRPLLAYHAFEGHVWETAVSANLSLGRQAVHQYVADQARQALERALAAADAGGLALQEARFEAHYLLSETLASLGLYDDAIAHVRAARALLPEVAAAGQDLERLAALDCREATVFEGLGDYQSALRAVRHGMGLPSVESLLVGARLYLVGADLFRRMADYEKAREWAWAAVDLAGRHSSTDEGLQVRSRATYMLALLSSLQRYRGGAPASAGDQPEP